VIRSNAIWIVPLMVMPVGAAVADEPVTGAARAVLHTTVERIAAEPRDPELLGGTTPESDARVAELQARLMQARQHPEAGPPFETLAVSPGRLIPRNPATDPDRRQDSSAPVTLFVNTTSSAPAPAFYRSEVAEPAVAASGDRVFYSANWFGSSSDDGGQSFGFINPSPGPFPAPSGESFCCDQTTAHDPGTNTTFWLQQFIPNSFNPPSTDTGTQRINVDRNSDGSWDCAYDISTTLVGLSTGTWFDFPDLAVSSNYLYHASNAFTFSSNWAGGFVGRYPLTEIAACSTPLSIDAFTNYSGSFRFSRGADDVMYFAAQPNNVSLRIWSWPDAASSPSWVQPSVAPWLNGSRLCPGPDGRNWCGFHDGRIQSGFVTGSTVGFMWTPSQGGGFPYPYLRISTFDAENDLAPIDDIDVWSPDVAYMYPSSSVNAAGELGGTVMWGGGDTHYPSCSAWMAETPTESDLVPLDHVTSIAGSVGPSNNSSRSGDYTMSVTYYPDDDQFAGACFAYLGLGSGTTTYVRFGRQVVPEIFADGFETGDTANWSASNP
jgi:hypothetical protein